MMSLKKRDAAKRGESAPEDKSSGKPRRGSEGGAVRRSVARLAAVQALYQMALGGAGPEEVITQFLTGRPDWMGRDHPGIAKMDQGLFCDVVRGVAREREKLDSTVEGALSKGRTIDRLEVLLRLILEAGTWELLSRADVPVRVVLSEYLGIADAFFEGEQPGLVNAVLDRLAHTIRDSEINAPASAGKSP
jgi:N utilization substance protein B